MRRLAIFLVLLQFSPSLASDEKASKEPMRSEDENAIIEATNVQRTQNGLQPLMVNTQLMTAARSHAANMAKQDKLSHDLDGQTAGDRVTASGYRFSRTGENIGWNFKTSREAVMGWMNSEGHRDNILSRDYTEIGVAVARNAAGAPYWVQVFATPRGQ